MTVVRELEYSLDKTKAPRKISFTRSRWQPGRTPLDKRRISNIPPPRKTLSTPKARAAERIVRIGWEVTTKLEEQQVGELEVQLPPWALALFFDLSWWGKPKYETLIQPPMLLRNATVRPHRSDGIMRITARRKDAEDIATQLENKVLLMGKQQLPINHLVRDLDNNVQRGQSLRLFRKEQLEMISQRTQSVFMQEKDGNIGIYSFRQPDRYNARRLLLSMLDLSIRNVKAVRLEPAQSMEGHSKESLALVPIFPDRGLHFRDRSKMLARFTLPERRRTPAQAAAEVQEQAPAPKDSLEQRAEGMSRTVESLTATLGKGPEKNLAPLAVGSQSPSSFWAGRPFKTSKTWWIHLGLILRESQPSSAGNLLTSKDKPASENDDSGPSVFLRQVPGYETLLSYFRPYTRQASQVVERPESNTDTPPDLVARKSTIVAHFTPSPFTPRGAKGLAMFPRLELTLLRRFGKGNEDGELKIESLRGILEEHIIDVPLPDQAIDVRMSRKVSSYANLSAVLTDPQIRDFVSALNTSVKAGGSLHGNSFVEFTMPGWMSRYDAPSRERQDAFYPEISMPYLFDRFEQIQSTGFRKNHSALLRGKNNPAIAQFNESFPTTARLEYKEIEAGDIGGGYTDISFKVKSEEERGPSMTALLTNTLAITNFITRACRGEIRTWRGASGLPRTNDGWEENWNEEPIRDRASSDIETANAVEEDEGSETSEEVLSADRETVEVVEEDGSAKTSEDISEADNESVKASEEDIIAQTSEEYVGAADTETINAGEAHETADASHEITGNNETAKTGDEDSTAESHTRP
jgi:hypothetical protein